MIDAYEKHKFPCGYEYESKMVWNWGVFGSITHEAIKCPIHGDKCKK